eukprot:COSAG03_NODE_33_length_18025_cov_70.016903_3_plen_215_part_00
MAMPYPKNPAHFQHHLSGHSSPARAAIGERFAQRSYCTLVAAHRAYDAGHKAPYARRHLCSCSSRRTAYKLRFGIIDWTSRNGGDFVDPRIRPENLKTMHWHVYVRVRSAIVALQTRSAIRLSHDMCGAWHPIAWRTDARVTTKTNQMQCIHDAHTMNLVCPVQNYDTYPSMPGALRASVCPDPSVTTGISHMGPYVCPLSPTSTVLLVVRTST